MNYILFAFGEYKENPQALNLLTETVSQISKGEIKFQHGDSGVIITFGTKLDWEDIDDYMKKNIVKLTAMYFVFPIDDMIYSMDEEIEKHLFENTDILTEKEELNQSRYTSDNTGVPEFFRGIYIHKGSPFDDILKILNEEVIKDEPVMTLNDLLDKIKEKGIDSLSEIQLKQLEIYSKQII
jgi:hypothetical protein